MRSSAESPVKASTKASTKNKVEIPVEDMTHSTVAVIVHDDGTEEIVKTAAVSENGLVLELDSSVAIKIVENSKTFGDVEGHWAGDAISFVTSRELLSGKSESEFDPNGAATRSQTINVLASFNSVGAANAILANEADGMDTDGVISRQELATMLWHCAGAPESEYALENSDADAVADYAQTAMCWAVENGILNGYEDGTLNPEGTASRAHLAVMTQRFCANVA